MHNLRTENYALFGRLTEDLSLGDSLSNSSEGLLQRGEGGARIYRSFLKTKTKIPGSWNIKGLLLIKENETSQVNEFSTFFLCRKMQESELIEIIPVICT